MIEPTRIYELGLACNALEAEPETAYDGQAPMVRRRRGAPDPVYAGSNKGEFEAGTRRFGHVPIAASVAM
jgi:hypothetical protein